MSISTVAPTPSTSGTFHRRGLSLRLRLVLLIVAITLPVFVIIAMAMYTEAQRLLIEYADSQIALNDKVLKDNVATWLNLNTKALEELASLPAITSMDGQQQKPYLQAMAAAYPEMYLVSTLDLSGVNVARSDNENLTDYSNTEWFKAIRSGAPVVYHTEIGVTTGRPAVVAATPISRSGEIVGAAMFSIDLSTIIDQVGAAKLGSTGYVYVIDDKNYAVAHPDPTLYDFALHDLSNEPAVQALRAGKASPYLYTDSHGITWHAYLATLPNGWGVIAQQSQEELLSPERGLQIISIGVFAVSILLLVVASWLVIGRTLNPISEMAADASVAAGGDLSVTVPVRRHDEVGALAYAFNIMIARLRELIGSLEQRINARTEQLRASADVGRAAVSILDTNQLLREIVNLITDRFHFYYTAVFLADNTGKWAVLREATGEAGQVLKERKHQLEVGGQSMVGSVMKTRKARIALDVGDEAVRFANPLLPNTRSEIALPLVVGSRVIGALDVQSTQPAAFDEASAAVLQSMADQIAIALSNTMQFQQAQAALQRTRQLYEASTAISNASDAPGVLDQLMIKAVTDADAAQILIYGPRDEAGQYAYFEVAAFWAKDERVPRRPIGLRVPSEQVLPLLPPTDEPHVIRDATDPAVPPDQQQIIQTMGMRAMLSYALTAGSQTLGLLLIVYREPHMFMPAETQPLQTLMGQIAFTLRNQQLVQEQTLARQQLDEINRRLTGQAWEQYAHQRGAALRKVDVRAGVPQETGTRLPAQLAAPVVIHGEEIGELRLEDAMPDRAWTPNEQALIQAVAGEVAIAIENARLIEQTERRAQREQTISTITSQIYSATDVRKLLQIAAEELRRATGSARAVIKLGRVSLPPDGSTVQPVTSDEKVMQ